MRKIHQMAVMTDSRQQAPMGAMGQAIRSNGLHSVITQSPKQTTARQNATSKQAGNQDRVGRFPSKRVVIRGGSEAPKDKDREQFKQNLLVETKSNNSMGSSGVNLLYLEDFDSDLDPLFINEELKPYF